MAKKQKTARRPAPNPVADRPVETITAAAPDPAPALPNWWERPWVAIVVPVLLALVAFSGSLNNGFVFFDDDKAILYNRTLMNPSLGGFFSGQNLGMYAPLTWIAYWIGTLISPTGQEAFGHHLLALGLHAFNAALVAACIRRITGNAWLALATAVLFAVHPMQTEAVAWAAALSAVLFSTFYLLAILAYVRGLEARAAGQAPVSWYALALLAFLAACLSKSAAITLPLVLLSIQVYIY
jgi:hypothetical protein